VRGRDPQPVFSQIRLAAFARMCGVALIPVFFRPDSGDPRQDAVMARSGGTRQVRRGAETRDGSREPVGDRRRDLIWCVLLDEVSRLG
jgi:hypothetical protein